MYEAVSHMQKGTLIEQEAPWGSQLLTSDAATACRALASRGVCLTIVVRHRVSSMNEDSFCVCRFCCRVHEAVFNSAGPAGPPQQPLQTESRLLPVSQ